MLREFLNNSQRAVDATYKAHAALKRGQVVAKAAGKVTALPAAVATSLAGLFLVDREPIDEGVNTYNIIKSDALYDNIAEGAYVKLKKYVAGEQFGTDQISGEIADGDYVQVGKDGLIAKVASGTSSLICRGTSTDGVTKVTIIEVLA